MADWTLNEDASLPILRKAVEAGINFFDTADIYSRGQSEEILGRGLKELGVRRDEAVVATKVFNPMGRGPNRGGLSRKHIMQSIDASLTRLRHRLRRPLPDPPLRLSRRRSRRRSRRWTTS